jgi:hypothetical protein
LDHFLIFFNFFPKPQHSKPFPVITYQCPWPTQGVLLIAFIQSKFAQLLTISNLLSTTPHYFNVLHKVPINPVRFLCSMYPDIEVSPVPYSISITPVYLYTNWKAILLISKPQCVLNLLTGDALNSRGEYCSVAVISFFVKYFVLLTLSQQTPH